MKKISILMGLFIIIIFWSCEESGASITGTFDEDELNARIDSLASVVAMLSLRVDSLEIITETPAFTKYVFTGEGDPWNDGVRIDIPFDFETHYSEIIWWIKKNDGAWQSGGSGWYSVENNRTRFTQCSGCATTWKCIIIDYGPNDG